MGFSVVVAQEGLSRRPESMSSMQRTGRRTERTILTRQIEIGSSNDEVNEARMLNL